MPSNSLSSATCWRELTRASAMEMVMALKASCASANLPAVTKPYADLSRSTSEERERHAFGHPPGRVKGAIRMGNEGAGASTDCDEAASARKAERSGSSRASPYWRWSSCMAVSKEPAAAWSVARRDSRDQRTVSGTPTVGAT
eukprot:scaffold29832_cov112-Isochrysis_galbana.AAC.8